MKRIIIIGLILFISSHCIFSQNPKEQLKEIREQFSLHNNPTINLIVLDKRKGTKKHSEELKTLMTKILKNSYPHTNFKVSENLKKLKQVGLNNINLAVTIIDYKEYRSGRKLYGKTKYQVNIVDARGEMKKHFRKQVNYSASVPFRVKNASVKLRSRSFLGANRRLLSFINKSLKAIKTSETQKQQSKALIDKNNRKRLQQTDNTNNSEIKAKKADIDINVPETKNRYKKRYALIIGNEDYSTYQESLNSESDVKYAIRDANTFKKYAIKTMGIPEENIIFKTNAKVVEFSRSVDKIESIIKNLNGEAEIIFYYAGHGFPDEKTKEPYLMPVDVSGTDLEYALKLKEIYNKFTNYPSKRITVFLDACFSGGARNQGLMAARGVKIQPREQSIKGNLVVFSASSGKQSSLHYEEKGHGIFTYYLLKKIQESNGKITYKELYDYLDEQIPVKSIMMNDKEQNPQINVSPEIKDDWENWKFH
jgi:hypothetical protein